MFDWLADNEGWVRWYALLLGFIAVGTCEVLRPRRSLRSKTPVRWAMHIAFACTSNLAGVLSVGVGAVLVAGASQQNPYGLLNHDALPFGVRFVAGLLLIDLVVFGLHIAYHRVPFLWRIHEAHHSDPDFDQTTGLRFHPVEALIGAVVSAAAVWVIALPPSAMAFRQASFILITFFSHSNIHVPEKLDRLLRRFIITPDLHRVHHSADPVEQRHNYGGYIPLWDHLFGTYQDQPALGHEAMQVGSSEIPERDCLNPLDVLIRPFRLARPRPEPSGAVARADS